MISIKEQISQIVLARVCARLPLQANICIKIFLVIFVQHQKRFTTTRTVVCALRRRKLPFGRIEDKQK